MIFTRARVSLALLFLRKNGGLLVVPVKHDEISLREFIVRRHQFQLKRRLEKKQLKNRMREKACQQMSFTDWF